MVSTIDTVLTIVGGFSRFALVNIDECVSARPTGTVLNNFLLTITIIFTFSID